jgi:hypothetical protein
VTELSMRWAATSGKSGVVRRRRDGSRSVVGKLGFGIDVGELELDRGGFRRMAAAAAGGGVEERRQIRLHMQMHRHAVMRTNETMKAAPAMLKAQLDIEAPRAEAL